jgi:hypothetical protein
MGKADAAGFSPSDLGPIGPSGYRRPGGADQTQGDGAVRASAESPFSGSLEDVENGCGCPTTERDIRQYHVQRMSQPGSMQNIGDPGPDGTIECRRDRRLRPFCNGFQPILLPHYLDG